MEATQHRPNPTALRVRPAYAGVDGEVFGRMMRDGTTRSTVEWVDNGQAFYAIVPAPFARDLARDQQFNGGPDAAVTIDGRPLAD